LDCFERNCGLRSGSWKLIESKQQQYDDEDAVGHGFLVIKGAITRYALEIEQCLYTLSNKHSMQEL
jgi:hypothetical protein